MKKINLIPKFLRRKKPCVEKPHRIVEKEDDRRVKHDDSGFTEAGVGF